MYTYYCIKVYLVNGVEGYAAYGRLTDNINEAMFFDTYDEARNWYYRNTRNASYGGVAVDNERCSICSCSSPTRI